MTAVASDPTDWARSGSLAPGEVLAGRYRIAAFLGRGAVGEVYEAFDRELGEAIAVKILRPEIARDERALQRFKREIQLARRVTHPNVCRAFDLVYHVSTRIGEEVPGDPPDQVLLTMELLRGETLEQLLSRQGRMSTAEALPVIGHIVAALAAAHANGVVHRDLKSGNIFLVPEPSGTRAVVTDFGLAWSSIESNDSANLTATGELVGSPAYMAPEQVRGEEATPATDIYALGVVLFEMVTGELPFVGKSAFYTALKRLQEPAPSPRLHLSDLDPAWEKTILRCLERDPAKRFPSVHHVLRALGLTKAEEDATSPLRLIESRVRRLRRRRRSALELGALALVLAVSGVWWSWQTGRLGHHTAPAATVQALKRPGPAVPMRPVVAVLPFDNLASGTEEARSRVFFELLPLELAASGKIRAVPAEEVDQAVRDLGATDAARRPDSSLPRLAERLGADFLVTGAYLPGPAGTRWDVALRGRSGTRTFSATGEEALESLAGKLRQAVGAGEPAGIDAESLQALRPNPASAGLWAEALHRLRRGEAPLARDLLQRAVKSDPDNPLLHSSLAEVLADLGYTDEAQREAKQAFALAAVLRREDRLPLEARYHETARAWEEAAASWQQIVTAHPDDLETGLRLAAAQTAAGRPGDAESTLTRLRLLPSPTGTDPRIDLAAGDAALASLLYRRAKDAAERTARRAEALGARRLVGHGRLTEARAQVALADLAGAARSAAAAKLAFSAAGDGRGEAEADRAIGLIRQRLRDLKGAQTAYDDALAIYGRLGAMGEMAMTLKEAGALHFSANDLDGAESLYRRGLQMAKRVGDRRAQAALLHNTALILRLRGHLPESKELFRQTLTLHRELGFLKGEAASLEGLSAIAVAEGDLLESRRCLQQAVEIYRRQGTRDAAAEALDNLANVSLERGDLAQSRQESEQAREEAQAAHREEGVARADRGIANVLRQQGDVAAARDLYERALLTYQRLRAPAQEAQVLAEIGVTLTLQGELIKALQHFQDALAIVHQRGDGRIEAAVLLNQGQAFHRFGEPLRAAATLKQAVALSRQLGVPPLQAEALVELGNVQRDQGDLAGARRSFEQALAIFRHRGARSGVASAQAGLGAVHLARRELSPARKLHEEALETRVDLGEKLVAAESRLALAEVALAEGQGDPAETAARAAVAAFRSLANPPGESAATLLLARCLLALGKTAAAREVLATAAPLLDGSQEPAVKNAAAELRARVGVARAALP